MAIKSEFTYDNVTTQSVTLTLYDLEFGSDYGLVMDEPTSVCMSNVTTPATQKDLVYFMNQSIPTVQNNLDSGLPQSANKGIHYGIRTESSFVTTDDSTPTFQRLDPVVVSTMIRHPNSSYINDVAVLEALLRHFSCWIKSIDSTGKITWRINDLMRSALRPNN